MGVGRPRRCFDLRVGRVFATVPDVVGQAQATAEANIVAAQLVVGTVTTAYSDTIPAGNVISQNPSGGASVAPGASVDIEVSIAKILVFIMVLVDFYKIV